MVTWLGSQRNDSSLLWKQERKEGHEDDPGFEISSRVNAKTTEAIF